MFRAIVQMAKHDQVRCGGEGTQERHMRKYEEK